MPILITVALAMIITIIIVVIKEDYWLDFGERVIYGFLTSLITMIISFLVIVALSTIPQSEEVFHNEIKISALKDNSNVSGSFFLGSGTIDEDTYYYYIKENNRGKVVEKIPTDNAYLNEGDYNPHIKVYRHEYTGKFARWYFGAEAWGGKVYEIYIPEGSVTTEFNIDLE